MLHAAKGMRQSTKVAIPSRLPLPPGLLASLPLREGACRGTGGGRGRRRGRPGKERIVVALFDDAAAVDHQDEVGVRGWCSAGGR